MLWVRIRIIVISWIRIRINWQMASQNVGNKSLFENRIQGFEPLFGSLDPDPHQSDEQGPVPYRIKMKGRIRIRIKVKRIRNTEKNIFSHYAGNMDLPKPVL